MAVRILLYTRTDWTMAATIAHTNAYLEVEFASNYSPIEDRTRSTPSLQHESRRASIETDKTSSCGSREAGSQKVVELEQSLKKKDAHIAKLQSKYEQKSAMLLREEQSHEELREKYATPTAQQLNDQSMIDQHCEAY
jgi:hypothetical protein